MIIHEGFFFAFPCPEEESVNGKNIFSQHIWCKLFFFVSCVQ